jgi:prepilin-type N-terminal cleavage/methylation domain-containing protein
MKKQKGFTLIELVVVMAIIAILMVVLIGAILAARNAATNTTNKANANSIRIGLEAHYSKYGEYCGSKGGITCPAAGTGFTALATSLNSKLGTDAVKLGTTSSTNGGGTATAIGSAAVTLQPVDNNNDPMGDPIKLP